MPDPCPHCSTTATALADWQAAEDEWKRVMDLALKPSPKIRHERTETRQALERRWACGERHGEEDEMS